MNYLSHFILAERDLTPTAAAASLLPDMLSYAGAGRRTHRVPDVPCGSPRWQEVTAGIQHHLQVDRAFHSSTWFDSRMNETLAWLRYECSPLLDHWSLWLLRHVAIELAIDGWLVRDDATLPERVYAALRTLHADYKVMSALEAEFGTDGGLRRYMGSMIEQPWLHVYAEPLAVAKALSRVFDQLLQRRPKLRDLYGSAPIFDAAQWAALPEFLDMVFACVRAGNEAICDTLVIDLPPPARDETA